MALTYTPEVDLGTSAIPFELPAAGGGNHTLDSVRGPRGLLVMFICNHCPYVKAIRQKLVRDAAELQDLGVGVVAINANDAQTYPEDSFENMAEEARRHGYPFPYLWDESQAVARAYGAVCTPDFFGYDADLKLRYRGRLDDAGARADARERPRELFAAMRDIAAGGEAPQPQHPSMGCSIKWSE
ncbi:MAG: thioredoxin family protein [Wenzhouxiangellaceae bacterium]